MSSTTQRMPLRSLLVLALLAIAVVWSLVVVVFSGDAEVTDDSLQQVSHYLQTKTGPRVVVVHPPWRDDIAGALRQKLGNADVRLAAPVDNGLPAGHLALLLVGSSPSPGAFAGMAASDQFAAGELRLLLYQGSPLKVDKVAAEPDMAVDSILLRSVKQLQVAVELGERRIECNLFDPAGPRYNCPGLREWNHVGARMLNIGGQSRRCLWAHPITDGRVVISAPWPRAHSLRLFHGLADTAVASAGGKPVHIELLAGERQIGRMVQRNLRGYNSQVVELGAEPADGRLVIAITTPHDGARHFCLDAQVETATPSGATGRASTNPASQPVHSVKRDKSAAAETAKGKPRAAAPVETAPQKPAKDTAP